MHVHQFLVGEAFGDIATFKFGQISLLDHEL